MSVHAVVPSADGLRFLESKKSRENTNEETLETNSVTIRATRASLINMVSLDVHALLVDEKFTI